MIRPLVTHGLLALVCTMLAYLAWTMPDGASESGTAIVSEDVGSLTEIHWKDLNHEVRVTPKPKGAPEVTVRGPEGEVTYPGSPRSEELLEEVANLEGIRSLGKVDEALKTRIGLHNPKGTLTVRFGERAVRIEVGDSTYGVGDLYLMNEQGEVFLTRPTTIDALSKGASSLLDRRLVALDPAGIARVRLKTLQGEREVVQRFAEVRYKAFISSPGAPDEKLTEMTNWLDRVVKTRIVKPVERKPSGAPAIELEFLGNDGVLGTLALWPSEGELAVAMSSFNASPVSLTGADADAIVDKVAEIMADGL